MRSLHSPARLLTSVKTRIRCHWPFCDVSLPTFMLTHWCRDRTRGPKFDLSRMIRAQTLDTAQAVGLLDRGVVAPGYLADLNVIDFERLRLHKPYMVYDLPTVSARNGRAQSALSRVGGAGSRYRRDRDWW